MPFDLFTPLRVGALELPNRIVMAPLTRCRAGVERTPNALMAEYYTQRAEAGLIISEATAVMPEGNGYVNTPGIYNAAQIAGWRAVTDAVHAAGGRMVLQLWHVGRISHPALQPGRVLPVAPSAIRPAGQAYTYEGLFDLVTPRALGIEELPGIVAAYRQATLNAREAGFDGVEVHGANGYLLDQFLRDGSNHRDDAYGGSTANRARLLLEVVDAVCAAWEPGRVGVRLSPLNSFNDMHDSDPGTLFGEVVQRLAPLGLAYLHMIEGERDDPHARHDGVDFDAFRRVFAGPYMANNGYDRARAMTAVANGHADLVAFGTAFIANPDLVRRLRDDAPLNSPDPETFYQGDATGYTDYPMR
ncbi:MAG: alkene reductase [Gammaproteobacteria bacterium]|nr:alkene reductase [Gammaproteobacteria bacterium]